VAAAAAPSSSRAATAAAAAVAAAAAGRRAADAPATNADTDEEYDDDDDEYEEDDDDDEDTDQDPFAAAASANKADPAGSPPVDEDALALAVRMARAASDTKASDVMVLDVSPLVSWTSYMVISTVTSRPQLMAVLARCEQAGAESGYERRNTPSGRSQWECLDFGAVVVHAMTPPQREAYAIEDFYGAADEVVWWEEEGEEGEKGGSAASPSSSSSSSPAWTTKTK
jgi:ribosome-associated protein